MFMKPMKAQITVQVDIEIDEEHGRLSRNDVLKGVVLRDSDVVDGYELTTEIAGCDPTADFFLKNGKIVSKEVIGIDLEKKRKDELFDAMLNHITEMVSGCDLLHTLHAIGFTAKDIAMCDVEIGETDED